MIILDLITRVLYICSKWWSAFEFLQVPSGSIYRVQFSHSEDGDRTFLRRRRNF